ncbi:PEP-CTERM sorting domain-containing protein [Coleofasciculus sp.]|uniref:PEP-CTERM sorting domain-containing protein n=1 Tax=Coleofasciculus sp. TaxID=3100458 RepID=UPI0039FB77F9
MKLSSLVPSVLAAAGVAVTASMMPAEAAVFGFNRITENNVENVANQLTVDVTGDSSNVTFKFTNSGPTSSFIAQIYVDVVGGLLAGPSVTNFAGTNFSLGGSPPNLPGGNTVGFTSDFRATANNPAPRNGASNTGEMVALNFSGNVDNVLAAIGNGSLRFGTHVQGIGSAGGSDSFVNAVPVTDPEAVPEPLTILGSATALGIGGLLKRQQSKKNNKA